MCSELFIHTDPFDTTKKVLAAGLVVTVYALGAAYWISVDKDHMYLDYWMGPCLDAATGTTCSYPAHAQ